MPPALSVPFLRFFDDSFSLDTFAMRSSTLTVTGTTATSSPAVPRSPRSAAIRPEIVKQTIGRHHQYPDGFVLFLGTMFAPVEDRDVKGQGFTHKQGDIVTVATPSLGRLVNRMRFSHECPAWTYGASHLMRNLARRGLLG